MTTTGTLKAIPSAPSRRGTSRPEPSPEVVPVSNDLAADLNRIEQTERTERDRRREEELARIRDLARFD